MLRHVTRGEQREVSGRHDLVVGEPADAGLARSHRDRSRLIDPERQHEIARAARHLQAGQPERGRPRGRRVLDLAHRDAAGAEVAQHDAARRHAEKGAAGVCRLDVAPAHAGVGEGLAHRGEAEHDVGRLARRLVAVKADADDVDRPQIEQRSGHHPAPAGGAGSKRSSTFSSRSPLAPDGGAVHNRARMRSPIRSSWLAGDDRPHHRSGVERDLADDERRLDAGPAVTVHRRERAEDAYRRELGRLGSLRQGAADLAAEGVGREEHVPAVGTAASQQRRRVAGVEGVEAGHGRPAFKCGHATVGPYSIRARRFERSTRATAAP